MSRLVAGMFLAVFGALLFGVGLSLVEYVQNQWDDCHDPEFLSDFSYQCRSLNLNVFVLCSSILSGALFTALGAWVIIDPMQKKWKPPKRLAQ